MEEAQRIVDQQAVKKGYVSADEYKDAHVAPSSSVDKESFRDLEAIRKAVVEDGDDTNVFALANGISTFKMFGGHRGINHPVKNLITGKGEITSQNHGFAVDEATLPGNVRAIHKSLFDGSLQGIERTDKSAFSFQGHPEASPGPNDVAPLFDRFINEMAKRR